jgi:hypothetical protein
MAEYKTQVSVTSSASMKCDSCGRFVDDQANSDSRRAMSPVRRVDRGSSEEHLVLAIADFLISILITAGWKGNIQQVRHAIMTKFSGRLEEVAKLAVQLNKAVANDSTLSDLEVVCLDQGIKFDSAKMDRAYGESLPAKDADEESGEDILCTSELGLRRVAKLGEISESEEGWDDIILLKPKVVLLSDLEETTKPPGMG